MLRSRSSTAAPSNCWTGTGWSCGQHTWSSPSPSGMLVDTPKKSCVLDIVEHGGACRPRDATRFRLLSMCRKTKEAVERVLSIGVQSTEEVRKLLAMEAV